MNYSDLNYSAHYSIQLSSEAVLESNLFLNSEVEEGWAYQGLLCRCLFGMNFSVNFYGIEFSSQVQVGKGSHSLFSFM